MRETEVPAQWTAVIAETTTWDSFPALWPFLLQDVWATVRSSAAMTANRNVMLYKDDVPNVEVGVEVAAPFLDMGRVVCSCLPAGRVVATTHHGSYEDLGSAHGALVAWCDRQRLKRLGPRWEIYGHWREGSEEQDVDISYLVR